MYNVIIENRNGALDLINNINFRCIDIEGVGGSKATINETENANIDGSIFNSSHLDGREIKIIIRIFKNCGESRNEIYKHATLKEDIKLTLVNDIRNVYIKGVVSYVDADLFSEKQRVEITIKCPEPYFNEINEIIEEFSNVVKKFHFPFAIEEEGIPFSILSNVIQAEIVNYGEVKTGAIFTFNASDKVVDPILYNVITGEKIKLNITMEKDDTIVIDTINREKSIMLIRNAIKSNILSSFDSSSTWLQLAVGRNVFSYTCTKGSANLSIYVNFNNKYLGV